MSWGYERGFVIEHDYTLKKRIDCKDCICYIADDKSCAKVPIYLAEAGYNTWKHCKHFQLSEIVNNLEAKKSQLNKRPKLSSDKNIKESNKKRMNIKREKVVIILQKMLP